jgi:maltose 6'-phosphate phosphatase
MTTMGIKRIQALLFLLVAYGCAATSVQAVQCGDTAMRGYLNVLSVNLLYTEIEQRDQRLEVLADFLAEQENQSDPVDLILLQEVVGGPVARTKNSADDLAALMQARGLAYDFRYQTVNGVASVISVGNAIFSRCEISLNLAAGLSRAREKPSPQLDVALRRGALMTRINVPGVGSLNVYDTHLCAYCEPEARLGQAAELLSWIGRIEGFFGRLRGRAGPAVLGGDFNTNVAVTDDLPVYERILSSGFADAYADYHGCTDCCSSEQGYAGCTFAAQGNPYAVDVFTGEIGTPQRIDYVFLRGAPLIVDDAAVVFASGQWVSDHSSPMVRIRFR